MATARTADPQYTVLATHDATGGRYIGGPIAVARRRSMAAAVAVAEHYHSRRGIRIQAPNGDLYQPTGESYHDQPDPAKRVALEWTAAELRQYSDLRALEEG